MPQPSKDTHLVWLAKPNKDLDHPSGYRPIGLSHPLAKVINRILKNRLNEYITPNWKGFHNLRTLRAGEFWMRHYECIIT